MYTVYIKCPEKRISDPLELEFQVVVHCHVGGVETGFFCTTVLAVLELALVDQAGLELIEIPLPLPP